VRNKRTLKKFNKNALKEEKNILTALPPSVHINPPIIFSFNLLCD